MKLKAHFQQIRFDWIIVTAVFVLALALRLKIQVRLFPDSIDYLTFAKNIFSGIHNTGDVTLGAYRRPPLYSHLIALFSSVNSSPVQLAAVARQISQFSGALLIFPVFWLGRLMLGTTAATGAALLAAVTPEFLYYSGAVLTESLGTLLIMVAMVLVWKLSREGHSWSLAAGAGIFLGLGFLSRNALIGFVPLAVLWLIFPVVVDKTRRNRAFLKMRGLRVTVLVIAFLITISPQIIYLHSEIGGWHLAVDPFSDLSTRMRQAGTDIRYSRSSEAISSLTPDGKQYIWEAEEAQGLLTTVVKQPGFYFRAYFTTVINGYLPDTYPLPYPPLVLLLAVAGILGLVVERKFEITGFLLWSFVSYYLFLALFLNIRDRYMYPVYPFLLIAAGAGVWFLLKLSTRWVKKEATRQTLEVVSLLVTTVLILAIMLPATLPFIEKQKKSADQSFFVDVGRDISGRIAPGSIMIDRTPHLPFYSGAIRTSPPYAEVEDVIRFCKTRGIRYWVVSTFYVPSLRPQFSSLLDPGRAPDGIKPIAIYNAGGNHRIIIYELLTA